jgi:hypothetical protein
VQAGVLITIREIYVLDLSALNQYNGDVCWIILFVTAQARCIICSVLKEEIENRSSLVIVLDIEVSAVIYQHPLNLRCMVLGLIKGEDTHVNRCVSIDVLGIHVGTKSQKFLDHAHISEEAGIMKRGVAIIVSGFVI